MTLSNWRSTLHIVEEDFNQNVYTAKDLDVHITGCRCPSISENRHDDSPSKGFNNMNSDVPESVKIEIPICRRCLTRTRSGLLKWLDLKNQATLFQCLAFTSSLIAQTLPYWEAYFGPEGNIHSGLFYVCVYGRCAFFFDVPGGVNEWLVIVQVLMTVGLVSLLCGLLCFVGACVVNRRPSSLRHFIVAGASIAFTFISWVTHMIGVALYGIKQGLAEGDLAWCYYLACISIISMTISLTLSILSIRNHLHTLGAKQRARVKAASVKKNSDCPPDGTMHTVSEDQARTRSPTLTRERTNSEIRNRERPSSEIRNRATSITALVSGCENGRDST